MSNEFDEEIAELVSQANASSLGVRRGSDHIKSATMSFGDATCQACWKNQQYGGCEQHRKRVVATTDLLPNAPFVARKVAKEFFSEPVPVPVAKPRKKRK